MGWIGQFIAAANLPHLNDPPPWLIVAVSAGIVSAVSIVQETRTTSLLLSRWAMFLATLVIALDIIAAWAVAGFVVDELPKGWSVTIKYVAVAAAAPAILRGLKVSIGKASIGPAFPYYVARSALLIRLDDEFGTRMEIKARLIAQKVVETEIFPRDLADIMLALVRRGRMTGAAKAQIGHILGALRAGALEDQVERLVELMYQYRMRALIRDLETGRIATSITRPRPIYLVTPPREPPTVPDPAPKRPPARKAARPRPTPTARAPARPDEDPQEQGRSGRQGQQQGPPTS